METIENVGDNQSTKGSQATKKGIPKKAVSFAKKVDQETAKLIYQLKEKINKKSFGRSITDADIIGKAIPLLTAQHLLELQELTYSQQDRLQLAFEAYSKENGKVSYEDFLAVLLKDLPGRNKKS